MIKFFPSLLRKFALPLLTTNIPKFYTSEWVFDPRVEHLAQIKMRQHRRLHLNGAALNRNKDVVFAQLRKPLEGMVELKDRGQCPAVIERVSQKVEQEVDIVLQGKKMRKLYKNTTYPLTPLYVRVDGKQYRCVFYKTDLHSDGFIQKCYLRQYVPGQPNKLKVPVQISHFVNNPYAMKSADIMDPVKFVDIICYNEEYPTKFYIDISFCCPDRPYRAGDLANTLPPGVMLAPNINLNDKLVVVIPPIKQSKEMREQTMKQMVDSTKKSKQPKPGAAGGDAAGKDKATSAGGATGGAAGGAGGAKAAGGGSTKAAGGASGGGQKGGQK